MFKTKKIHKLNCLTNHITSHTSSSMSLPVAQDVASIIATRAESFLEQYEGSGVINLTSAQKHALGRELVNDRTFHFDLLGGKI